jgi:hypothetical protein
VIDDKIARVKALILKREEIDAELSALFGITPAKRGRPRKDDTAGNGATAAMPAADPGSPAPLLSLVERPPEEQ